MFSYVADQINLSMEVSIQKGRIVVGSCINWVDELFTPLDCSNRNIVSWSIAGIVTDLIGNVIEDAIVDYCDFLFTVLIREVYGKSSW
jgi:hypothetical protein